MSTCDRDAGNIGNLLRRTPPSNPEIWKNICVYCLPLVILLKFKSGYYIYTHRVSQEECARLWESVPYVKVYRYNPKHLYPKLNSYGDNDQRSVKL